MRCLQFIKELLIPQIKKKLHWIKGNTIILRSSKHFRNYLNEKKPQMTRGPNLFCLQMTQMSVVQNSGVPI